MIYIEIIVLILVAIISYRIGLKKKDYSECQECFDEIYMQGYDAGAYDQTGYQNLGEILKESVLVEPAQKKTPKAKKVAKKAVKKGK